VHNLERAKSDSFSPATTGDRVLPRSDPYGISSAQNPSIPDHDYILDLAGPNRASNSLNAPTEMNNPRQQKREPDWAEFYKNGLPNEIIVIDDDEPQTSPRTQPRPTQPNRTTTTNGSTRHTDKKRKTTASTAYDPVYNQQTSYSTTQTPYYDNSPSNNTISTDRTTSAINTTAATSLGSQASNGAYIPPLEIGTVGQKRKRTRRAAQDEANEAKRREVDLHGDPFSLYVPPPNPPIKAKEVFVQVVADVSFTRCPLGSVSTLILYRNHI